MVSFLEQAKWSWHSHAGLWHKKPCHLLVSTICGQQQIEQNLEQLQTSNSEQLEQIQSDAQTKKEQILTDLAKITPQEVAANALNEIQEQLHEKFKKEVGQFAKNHTM